MWYWWWMGFLCDKRLLPEKDEDALPGWASATSRRVKRRQVSSGGPEATRGEARVPKAPSGDPKGGIRTRPVIWGGRSVAVTSSDVVPGTPGARRPAPMRCRRSSGFLGLGCREKSSRGRRLHLNQLNPFSGNAPAIESKTIKKGFFEYFVKPFPDAICDSGRGRFLVHLVARGTR